MEDLKKWQKLALWAADRFPKNKLSQDLAYKIISDRQVGYQAGATKSDIVRNMFSFKPKDEDTNKYIIAGILGMLIFQQIQNIGMTIGLFPITGITLPFISYGGSSLLSYMLLIGILLNISDRKNRTYKYK